MLKVNRPGDFLKDIHKYNYSDIQEYLSWLLVRTLTIKLTGK